MGIDVSDLLVIDTSDDPDHGGSIWLTSKHGFTRAFRSLEDAIQAAIWSVENEIWVIDNGVSVEWPGRLSGRCFAGSPVTDDWLEAVAAKGAR